MTARHEAFNALNPEIARVDRDRIGDIHIWPNPALIKGIAELTLQAMDLDDGRPGVGISVRRSSDTMRALGLLVAADGSKDIEHVSVRDVVEIVTILGLADMGVELLETYLTFPWNQRPPQQRVSDFYKSPDDVEVTLGEAGLDPVVLDNLVRDQQDVLPVWWRAFPL